MIAAPRPTPGPLPGDLYLDPAVPDCERVTISRNGWSAQASHVWTGTGWTRLVPGVVHDVPAHPEVTLPGARALPSPRSAATAAAPAAEGLERWRRRRAALEQAHGAAAGTAPSRSVADAS
ncbi:hypothetical protein [Quadrisphaera sp. KR29]|uniref:hypothetical protein n=1 Tax=Quadrisphaera sp. KR29 TaxID=3461391 RepID=UPI004044EAB2